MRICWSEKGKLEWAVRRVAEEYGDQIEAYARQKLIELVDSLLQDVVGVSVGDVQDEAAEVMKLVMLAYEFYEGYQAATAEVEEL